MRFLRILLLHFQHVIEHRARSFVWLLVSLFNPLLFILFWKGAFQGRTEIAPSWTFSSITTYYFVLTIVASTLMAHIEESVSQEDIEEGGLVRFLLKPYSYFWIKFSSEIHYRLLQGAYGIIVLFIFLKLFSIRLVLATDIFIMLLTIIIMVLAYFLSFIFKMIIGFIAFWTTSIRGVYSLVDIILLIFAGYIMPLELLIRPIDSIAKILPFSYMIYFPVVSIQGKYNPQELLHIVGAQVIWLMIFLVIYRIVWSNGLKKFSGVGQ